MSPARSNEDGRQPWDTSLGDGGDRSWISRDPGTVRTGPGRYEPAPVTHTETCLRLYNGEPIGTTETCICGLVPKAVGAAGSPPGDTETPAQAPEALSVAANGSQDPSEPEDVFDYAEEPVGFVKFVPGVGIVPLESDVKPDWDKQQAMVVSRLSLQEEIALALQAENKNLAVRPGWDEWALGIAAAVALRADCTRRQVGVVILDAEHRVIATGYNGYPSGQPGCASAGACPRGRRSHAEIPADSPYVGTDAPCLALHAEENAVLHARQSLKGCTVYVTHAPCPNCQRYLAGTGVSRAVWRAEDGSVGEMSWA